MKKLVSSSFLFLFFLCSSQSFSQYYSMPSTVQTTWRDVSIAHGVLFDTLNYINQGDTMIANTNYQKLYRYYISDSTYVGAYRDDGNGKVYFLGLPNSLAPSEVLLYDFTLEVGDTIDLVPLGLKLSPTKMTPINVGCTKIKNVITGQFEERKRLDMVWLTNSGNGEWGFYSWLEGYGSSKGLIARGTPSGWDYEYHRLNIFQNGDSILNNSVSVCDSMTLNIDKTDSIGKVSVFPNPVQDYLNVEGINTDESYTIQIHDAYGREIFTGQMKANQLDLTQISPGILYITIENNGVFQRFKVLKV